MKSLADELGGFQHSTAVRHKGGDTVKVSLDTEQLGDKAVTAAEIGWLYRNISSSR